MGVDDLRRAIDVESVIIIVTQGDHLKLTGIADSQFPNTFFEGGLLCEIVCSFQIGLQQLLTLFSVGDGVRNAGRIRNPNAINHHRHQRSTSGQKSRWNLVQFHIGVLWIEDILPTQDNLLPCYLQMKGINGAHTPIAHDIISRFKFWITEQINTCPEQRVIGNPLPIHADRRHDDPYLRCMRAWRHRMVKPDHPIEIRFPRQRKGKAADATGFIRRVGIGWQATLKPTCKIDDQHL